MRRGHGKDVFRGSRGRLTLVPGPRVYLGQNTDFNLVLSDPVGQLKDSRATQRDLHQTPKDGNLLSVSSVDSRHIEQRRTSQHARRHMSPVLDF